MSVVELEKNTQPLALVTGAAHRVGYLFALKLARLGYAILLHYYNSGEAAVLAAKEISALGIPVFTVKANLTELDEIRSLFRQLDSLNLSLKILVNCAAEMKREDPKNESAEVWDSTLNLNLRAPLFLSQSAAERMSEGGQIINITDVAMQKTWTDFPAYLVSKAGMEMLTRLLAKTYAPSIRVNAIALGLAMKAPGIPDEEWVSLVNRLPLKHPVSAEDISIAIDFLLKSDSITGQTIVIDGGYSLL